MKKIFKIFDKKYRIKMFDWISKNIFHTYDDWFLKTSCTLNNVGFHISAIEKTIKLLQNGRNMYTELIPPASIKGCVSIKAIRSKNENLINIFLHINNQKYIIEDTTYEQAIQIMKNFVTKSQLPDESLYHLAPDNSEIIKKSFTELSKMLIGDEEECKKFLKNIKIEDADNTNIVWRKLYRKLLKIKKADELDWKCDKEDFVYAVKGLIFHIPELHFDEKMLDENADIISWCQTINSYWKKYRLGIFDIQSDSYVIIVLTNEDFMQAKNLANILLQRIDIL